MIEAYLGRGARHRRMRVAAAESRASGSPLWRSRRRRRYFLAGRGRADRGAARLERRRQDHDASAIAGLIRPAGGRIEWRGRRFLANRPTRSSVKVWRCRRKAGGCSLRRRSSRICGSAQPRSPTARASMRCSTRLCAVSAACRAAPAGGRHAVGRRTADAGARPRADERAAAVDARRASLGLAPAVVDALYDTLAELHRQGLTLFLAEQSIPLALDRRLRLCAADRPHRAGRQARTCSATSRCARFIWVLECRGRVETCARFAERIECLGEQTQHGRRIGRGQHAAAPSFEEVFWRAGECRRRIERPAEMFARVAQPEFDAVEAEHFAVERAGERELLAERRRRCALAGREIARQAGRETTAGLGRRARPSQHRRRTPRAPHRHRRNFRCRR